MGYGVIDARRPDPDGLLVEIADYVCGSFEPSDEAVRTAAHCLMDSLGCALMALKFPACTKLLGPLVPGAEWRAGQGFPVRRLNSIPSKRRSTSAA